MSGERLVSSVELFEDNWGFGDHRGWDRKGRIAWHEWYERETGEKCDCPCLESGV